MNEPESSREQFDARRELVHGSPTRPASWHALLTDAIRYWEPRRFIYNAALVLVVVGYFFAEWPVSRTTVRVDGLLCSSPSRSWPTFVTARPMSLTSLCSFPAFKPHGFGGAGCFSQRVSCLPRSLRASSFSASSAPIMLARVFS